MAMALLTRLCPNPCSSSSSSSSRSVSRFPFSQKKMKFSRVCMYTFFYNSLFEALSVWVHKVNVCVCVFVFLGGFWILDLVWCYSSKGYTSDALKNNNNKRGCVNVGSTRPRPLLFYSNDHSVRNDNNNNGPGMAVVLPEKNDPTGAGTSAAACSNFLSFESVSRREVVLAGLLAGLAFPSAYIVDQAAAAEALGNELLLLLLCLHGDVGKIGTSLGFRV